MEHISFWFWVAQWLLAATCIFTILRRRGEPAAMLAWIFAVVVLPVLGVALYILFGSNRVHRKARRRRRRLAHLIHVLSEQAVRGAGSSKPLQDDLPPDLAAVEQMGRRVGGMPASGGNEVSVLQGSERTYAAIEEAIRAARHHVHLEFYIWQPDETGRRFRDLLAERAREGVECRVLLDSVGCLRLGRRFTQPWADAGVKLAFFLPLYRLPKRWSLHLRNHRKIVVIDGAAAFIGSQNVGDEYRGRLRHLSPWYDSNVRMRGPAALFAQQVFAEDWLFATRQNLLGKDYFPTPAPVGPSVVQILPSGPDHDVNALGQLLFVAVSSAQRSITIATPYFVPDEGMRMALIHAAYRGVRVRLVLPTRSDNRLVLWAGRSYYAELLEAGVEIYEFDAGMLHAKIVTIDDRWCMVGSANMDIRSFRFNFEASALVYDPQVARGLAEDVDQHIARSTRVTLRETFHRPLPAQLGEGLARLFAPLL